MSFSPAVNYAAGADPREIVTADFNNDSILDVAVANTSSGTVGVLLGDGNGTFQDIIPSPTGNRPSSLAVGDFNGDGKPDLVTAGDFGSSYTQVTVLRGNGNGTFGPPTSYHPGFGYGVDTVTVGDFNADGNLDVAITALHFEGGGSDGSYVGVLRGTGDGTFIALPAWPWEGGWSALGGFEFLPDTVAADFNADGKLDIAAPSFYGYLPVAFGNGNGTFGSQWVFSGVNEGSSILAADFNADGKVDLAAAGNSSVGVLLGNGTGVFNTTQSYATGSGSLSDLAVGDFNGDGKLDLITSNNSNGTVGVLLGTGAGAFNLAVIGAVGTGPAGVAVRDFNGDGRPDVATANPGSNNLSVLLNDGNWPNKIWIGSASGNWGTAGNWSPGGAPGPADHVLIGSSNVTLGSSATVAGVTLTGGATLSVGADGGRILRTASVSLLGSSRLDLNDNVLIIDYADVSPMPALRSALASGYAAGAWNGNGISSSTAAAASGITALGYAEASSLVTIPPIFGSVDATALLVRYTRYGDADLSAGVDLADFNRLAGNFGQSDTLWSQGDFNYDDVTNLGDFNLLASSFGQAVAPRTLSTFVISGEPSASLDRLLDEMLA